MINGGKLIDFSFTIKDIKDVKIFFGDYDGIQRYDRFKYRVVKALIELQQAQKWFPKEISHLKDKITVSSMSEGLRDLYQKNLGFQTIADSLANRFLDNVLSEYITSPEWENCIKWQANFELLHSESYSHTIREVYGDSSKFFNDVLEDPFVRKRLEREVQIYQKFSQTMKKPNLPLDELKMVVLEAIIAQYVLENIRFMISFLYTFKINQITKDGIIGTANSISLIANDETIHTVIFRHLFNILKKEESEEFKHLFNDPHYSSRISMMIKESYDMVIESEMEWFEYLRTFEEIPGMDTHDVKDFLHHYANESLCYIGYDKLCYGRLEAPTELIDFFEKRRNIADKKVLGQENDTTSYTIGGLKDIDPERNLDMKKEVNELYEGLMNG